MSRLLKLPIFAAAGVALALFAAQLIEIPARSALRGYDNTFNYLWLRSAAVDGDWDFRNDLETADTLVPEQRVSASMLSLTPIGRVPNKYGVGWALATAPGYLVGDAVVAMGRAAGWWRLERDGFNFVYQIAVQLWHLAFAFAALWLAVCVIRRWVGDRSAAVAGVVSVWAASPLIYYQTANPSMSHGAAFFAITLFAYAIERARSFEAAEPRGAWGWWVLAGAAFGLAVITRFQLAVFGTVIVGALFGRTGVPPVDGAARRESGHVGAPTRAGSACDDSGTGASFVSRKVWPTGLLALGAAPLLLLQLWAWHSVYGEWLVFGYGAEGEAFHWSKPQLWNSLFSPWHGAIYWHPFLGVAVLGTAAWAWTRRGDGLAWMLALIATWYVNAAWWCWWFASSFGGRAYDAALLPLMGGVAWLYRRAGDRGRRVLVGAAIAAGGWNAYLVLLYRTGAISRSEPVTWAEMLAAAFRLPEALSF